MELILMAAMAIAATVGNITAGPIGALVGAAIAFVAVTVFGAPYLRRDRE
jgi:hypothetical protein